MISSCNNSLYSSSHLFRGGCKNVGELVGYCWASFSISVKNSMFHPDWHFIQSYYRSTSVFVWKLSFNLNLFPSAFIFSLPTRTLSLAESTGTLFWYYVRITYYKYFSFTSRCKTKTVCHFPSPNTIVIFTSLWSRISGQRKYYLDILSSTSDLAEWLWMNKTVLATIMISLQVSEYILATLLLQ
jgi:hypothetical protein